ncbi:galaxin-like [Montipora foliosa]|uniref:galaxin-like n=1 Tax=Montipora foliosa TaxID=591990 RepID=UPI0035F14608
MRRESEICNASAILKVPDVGMSIRKKRQITARCGNGVFDPTRQQCCQDVVHNNPYNNPVCCLTQLYDGAKYVCCRYRAYERKWGSNTQCCDFTPFDGSKHVCCDGKILPASFRDSGCCGSKVIDASKYMCCGGRQVSIPAGKPRCCGNNAYDANKFICCLGQYIHAYLFPATACCGPKVYDPTSQICCPRYYQIKKQPAKCHKPEVSPVPRSRKKLKKVATSMFKLGFAIVFVVVAACNFLSSSQAKDLPGLDDLGSTYDFQTEEKDVGISRRIKRQITARCGSKVYDPTRQVCCQDVVHNNPFNNPVCCLTQLYDGAKYVCCRYTAYERKWGSNTQCCDFTPFDGSKHICCDRNKILPAPFPRSGCCGSKVIDASKYMCCGGRQVSIPAGRSPACCGNNAYDSAKFACCGGVIQPYLQPVSACCGPKTYDPTKEICCPKYFQIKKLPAKC